jgi:hypothetical protein
MRAVLVVLAIVLAAGGCYNPTPPAGAPCGEDSPCPTGQQCINGFCGGNNPNVDASLDDSTTIDAPSVCLMWQVHHFDPCALPAPMGDLNLTNALSGFTWDTNKPELKGKMNTVIPVSMMVMTQAIGPEVLVASVDNLTLEAGANLNIDGSRALLIAVWGSAMIAGSIDADASFSTAGPGGSNASLSTNGCGSGPTGDFGAGGSPATGGGGGAMQGNGGRGGNNGGLGGVGVTPPTTIQGGCAGGGGGAGTGIAGSRGAGGGAIQITARQSITIPAGAVIHAAGGAGGSGRLSLGAGGAGGAGGYIGLDAPMVLIGGVLSANGGSGGGGASDVANGTSGSNGRPDASAAIGGSGATASNVGACGRGGNGSAGGTLGGENGLSSSCGGGGGGGGAGYILIWSPALDVTGTVSPPVTAGP